MLKLILYLCNQGGIGKAFGTDDRRGKNKKKVQVGVLVLNIGIIDKIAKINYKKNLP